MNDDYKYETERFKPNVRCNMPKDYKLEDYLLGDLEPDVFLDYRTKLGNSYFALENTRNKMDTLLRRSEDYPSQLSKDEAQQAQKFLKELGLLLQEYFSLFVGMSDD